MQAVRARVTRGLPLGCFLEACDNSGAKIVKLFGVKGHKTTKGRSAAAGVGDMVLASVKKGSPEMRKQVVFAVVVRQKKEYRRPSGERIKFVDNAVIVLKDEKGNPKGTLIKGPVAKEAADRYPGIAKLANIII